MLQMVSFYMGASLHFDVFLPTSSRIFKVSIFQLRHSPFFTWFVLSFTSRSHRLSSHSRLNAFVIQTKLNLYGSELLNLAGSCSDLEWFARSMNGAIRMTLLPDLSLNSKERLRTCICVCVCVCVCVCMCVCVCVCVCVNKAMRVISQPGLSPDAKERLRTCILCISKVCVCACVCVCMCVNKAMRAMFQPDFSPPDLGLGFIYYILYIRCIGSFKTLTNLHSVQCT